MKNTTISFYGAHDANATYIDKLGKLRILEYERFAKKRYAMFTNKHNNPDLKTNDQLRKLFVAYIAQDLSVNPEEVNLILFNELDENDINDIRVYFPNAIFVPIGHHLSHASTGFYQSGFDDAIILSVDGGGWDNGQVSMTNIFKGTKSNGIEWIQSVPIDLGTAYMQLGHFVSELHGDGRISMSYSGKMMGLCGYGKVRMDWIAPMIEYYNSLDLSQFATNVQIPNVAKCLSGSDSYDLAATSQYVFEYHLKKLIRLAKSKVDSNNIVMVGGCALNVIYNQKLVEEYGNVFVPPNPNDCGLSLGQYLLYYPDSCSSPITYNNFPILDNEKLIEYVERYNAQSVTALELAKKISDGYIVGIIDGDSEVGPRALGNRSIICNAAPGMKDTLNAKIKHRESFRPFAPVCRLEDKDEMFDNAAESAFMSYSPTVKDEIRDEVRSIVHVDGTARLQTVTKDQHKLFYDILSCLNRLDRIPVILNTSFNVNGLPIITTLEDALQILETTELDYVYSGGYLFSKQKVEK